MKNVISYLVFLCLAGITISANGQRYFTNGNASSEGGSCYQLTEASNWQLGSVWYADKLDLTQGFDLEFELNFGNKDRGADGVVFVLQTVGTKAIGESGGGLGFEGFSPSFGIEFDTWQNHDMGDVAYDHIGILTNGSVNHNSSNSLVQPVNALMNNGNIEDGKNHLVRISWDASTGMLKVYFDCELRIEQVIDLKNDVFNSIEEVYWGFTSATGGENNVHVACLKDDIVVADSFFICEGESVQLNSRESVDGEYSWSPVAFLSSKNVKNPVSNSVIPIMYYVEFKDQCGRLNVDSVYVGVEVKPDVSELADVTLCEGDTLTIKVDNQYGEVLWNQSIRGNTFFIDQYEGDITVSSKNDCGADSTSFEVIIDPCDCEMSFPNIITPNDDELNDWFGPIDPCSKLTSYHLTIYNRWGERVFESNNVSNVWDATINGNRVAEGVYFWLAEWSFDQKEKVVSGDGSGAVQVLGLR